MSAHAFTVDPGVQVLLADLGLDRVAVTRRAGLPADLFARRPIVLTAEQFFAFWEALVAEADDPDLPITIGRAISVESFDPAVFAALCSPNLRVAAHRIAQYKPLIGPMTLDITEDDDTLTIGYVWPDGLEPPDALRQTELVFWVALARIATRHEVRPLSLTLPRPPPDETAYRAYLGCEIRPAVDQSVTFTAVDADRPFLTSNDAMWRSFEPALRRRLSELEPGSTTAERVRGALLELLPSGLSTMDATASELAMSTRTLQRRLKEEGTTYQALLGATREDLARHYLTRADLSTGEISFLLGYEDPNSFYRAFHGWTGSTPQQVRAAAS